MDAEVRKSGLLGLEQNCELRVGFKRKKFFWGGFCKRGRQTHPRQPPAPRIGCDGRSNARDKSLNGRIKLRRRSPAADSGVGAGPRAGADRQIDAKRSYGGSWPGDMRKGQQGARPLQVWASASRSDTGSGGAAAALSCHSSVILTPFNPTGNAMENGKPRSALNR